MMKKCECEDFNICDAVESCMYDFVSVTDVPDLGTVVIEDKLCDESVVVCYEHIPELIAALQGVKGVNSMEQWVVKYNDGDSITRCLFNDLSDAESYAIYINAIFNNEVIATVRKVIVKYV